MIRRDKREVMPDLPDKIRQMVVFPDNGIVKQIREELSAVRRGAAAYEAMLGLEPVKNEAVADLRFWKAVQVANGHFTSEQTPFIDQMNLAFEEFSEARKKLAIAKIPMCKAYIDDLLQNDEKVIIFCHHTEVAEALRSEYPTCAFVTGKVPSQKRQAQVDKFQEDKNCNELIGNIDAAGVGFTMTAATHVVFIEFVWSPTQMEQAEDRAWRTGQKNVVTIHYLMVENSFDARNIHILEEKYEIIRKALDFNGFDDLDFFAKMLQVPN
jgi:SWI/SNF-related matrix-associated actin-dependent regulator 1 of chromatin subfamily A